MISVDWFMEHLSLYLSLENAFYGDSTTNWATLGLGLMFVGLYTSTGRFWLMHFWFTRTNVKSGDLDLL